MSRFTSLDPLAVVPLRRSSLGYRYRDAATSRPYLVAVLLLTASLLVAVAVGL